MAGSRLTDRRLPLAAICLFVAVLGLWNAAHYPTGAGYDAHDHRSYADGLIPGFKFPQKIGEYYTPPGFYFLAGSVDWVARKLGFGDPDRATQALNLLFLLGTVLLVAAIARALWPGRRRIELGAAAFVAFLPVVIETTAMFHPEPLSLLLSTLALYLCVRTFSDPRWAWALGITLGAAQLVRAWSLVTVGAVAIALLAARRYRPLAIVLVLAALIPSPWYIHQRVKYGGQPQFTQPAQARQSLGISFYVNPGIPGIVTQPARKHHYALWIPTTYDGLWGDYFGIWRWHSPDVTRPSAGARHHLELQSLLGIVPTLLALIGWALFAIRSWRDRAGLAIALLPPLAIAAYLYFAVVYWSPDGDLLKATYMLTATAGWAIGFGYALDRIRGRLWPITLVLLGLFALAELPFLIY